MKKKTKIILGCIIALCIVVILPVGMIYGPYLPGFSGTIMENVQEGSDEYDWKKYEVDIPLGTEDDPTKYYTNCEEDYIDRISYKMYYVGKGKQVYDRRWYSISYFQNFSWSDDLLTVFVLSDGANTYTTNVIRCDIDVGIKTITFSPEDRINNKLTDDSHIVEIWVKTED